jgi:hypothetical protein
MALQTLSRSLADNDKSDNDTGAPSAATVRDHSTPSSSHTVVEPQWRRKQARPFAARALLPSFPGSRTRAHGSADGQSRSDIRDEPTPPHDAPAHHIFSMALVTDIQLAETVAVPPPRIVRVLRSTHSAISSGEVKLTRQWEFPEMGKWRRQRRVCALAKACVHFSKTKAKRKTRYVCGAATCACSAYFHPECIGTHLERGNTTQAMP